MAKEDRAEKAKEEKKEEVVQEGVVGEIQQPAGGPTRVKLNFQGVVPQYANFCTFAVRGGEVFMSFGKAFVPTEELKVDSQIVMSLRNLQQMHQAIGRLLDQARKQGEE